MFWCGAVVGRGGGGGAVMTTMRMRLVLSFSFVDLRWCGAVVGGGGCLTFHTSTMQKPRVFAAFQTNFATDPKIEQTKHEKHGICDTFAKTLPKNNNKKHWKTKTPKRRVVGENLAKHRAFVLSTKKPPKHKRHTPRGGRRTCYLVVVIVVAVIYNIKHGN